MQPERYDTVPPVLTYESEQNYNFNSSMLLSAAAPKNDSQLHILLRNAD